MKTTSKLFRSPLLILALLMSGSMLAQQPTLQFHRANNASGLNIFEPPKADTVPFEGVKVRVGGDFAMQLQGIDHSNTNDLDTLVMLSTNMNLPSANLNLDIQLHDGVKLHMRTFLSSRHHNEAWVKGGHLQIDKLDFIQEDFLKSVMDVTTITVGLDEPNYGDAHFRRTDNARAIFNPFVGNYIMDSYTTEVFGEVLIRKSGFLGLIGVTNGKLNQSVVVTEDTDNQLSIYGKLGYDDYVSDDLRVRLTGSFYMNNGMNTGTSLYGGDRAGARYYNVMRSINTGGSNFEGRFNPRFNQLTAIQINPFIKFKGLEFFGIYEMASNSEDLGSGSFTQIAGELLYRFGSREQFYVGGRYNAVSGNASETADDQEISRMNFGGGWYMTNNVMMKVEYVSQTYSGDGFAGSKYEGGEFSGINLEAVISF